MIPPTITGYGLFEAKRALQKGIRRANTETSEGKAAEQMAIYFAVEFFSSGLDEALWRQLKIICSEDIGIAEPNMPANINALYQSYTDQKKDKKENKPERMFLIHAVLLLCRAKKSRLVDYELVAHWRDHGENKRQLPDYVYDMHSAKGKSMGRGMDHFYTEGTVLSNPAIQPGEPEAYKKARALHEKIPGKLKFVEVKKGTLTQNTLNFNGHE